MTECVDSWEIPIDELLCLTVRTRIVQLLEPHLPGIPQ